MSVPTYITEVADKARCLYSKQEVEAALDSMAQKIHDELHDKNPVLVSVMIGGLIPTASLLQRLDFPLEVDYIHVTRYFGKTSGGELYWKVVPNAKLEGRHVLIIDDILDKGLTMAAILNYCEQEGAAKVYSAVLVDKDVERSQGGTIQADFTGIKVENAYIYGYGMDYKEYLRNANGIYAVADEHK